MVTKNIFMICNDVPLSNSQVIKYFWSPTYVLFILNCLIIFTLNHSEHDIVCIVKKYILSLKVHLFYLTSIKFRTITMKESIQLVTIEWNYAPSWYSKLLTSNYCWQFSISTTTQFWITIPETMVFVRVLVSSCFRSDY